MNYTPFPVLTSRSPSWMFFLSNLWTSASQALLPLCREEVIGEGASSIEIVENRLSLADDRLLIVENVLPVALLSKMEEAAVLAEDRGVPPLLNPARAGLLRSQLDCVGLLGSTSDPFLQVNIQPSKHVNVQNAVWHRSRQCVLQLHVVGCRSRANNP